jgi:hypothetical protein
MHWGVLLYVVETRDREAFRRWLAWLDANRPCTLKWNGSCLAYGLLRFCRDDFRDKRCTVRPQNCAMIEAVGRHLNVDTSLCSAGMNGPLSSLGVAPQSYARLAAYLNSEGYPTHLAGVQALLLAKLGEPQVSEEIGRTLAWREPQNPYFAFLARRPREQVEALLLSQCPSEQRPSVMRHEWAWERKGSAEAWRNSMYWDCTFIAFLKRGAPVAP